MIGTKLSFLLIIFVLGVRTEFTLSDYLDGNKLIINGEELTSVDLLELNVSSMCCLTSVDLSHNNLTYFPDLLGSKGSYAGLFSAYQIS